MRTHYWSCSKFADWLRGTPKISMGTGKEWADWEKQAREAHPIRYWIADTALDKLQDIWMWIPDRLHGIKYYINNRWVSKTHVMASHTLKPGKWHEFDQRMIHCLFEQLIDFVEIEQAWHHIAWDKEAREKYKAPWWSWGWFRWRVWRCPEAGIDYLKWASTLKYDDDWADKDSPNYGKPTPQAVSALETLQLYNWWKNIRCRRPDPMDASGWSDICERRRQKYNDILWEDETEEEKAATRAALDKIHEIEQQYDKEDEEMLIRLVKIRQSLWT